MRAAEVANRNHCAVEVVAAEALADGGVLSVAGLSPLIWMTGGVSDAFAAGVEFARFDPLLLGVGFAKERRALRRNDRRWICKLRAADVGRQICKVVEVPKRGI
jgi:hypothetical protein